MNNEALATASFINRNGAQIDINNAATSGIVNGTAINAILQNFQNLNANININSAITSGITNYSYFGNGGSNSIINIQNTTTDAIVNQTGISGGFFVNYLDADIIICSATNGINNVSGLFYNGAYSPASPAQIYIHGISGTGLINQGSYLNIDNTDIGSLLEIGTPNICGSVNIGINLVCNILQTIPRIQH